MRATLSFCLLALALAGVGAAPAEAARSSGVRLTEQDLKQCMGIASASPQDQIAVCTKILKSGKVKHPHQSEYYAFRAAAYLALKQPAKAIEDLDRALGLVAKAEFRFQRALALMALARFADARGELELVSKAKPDFAPAPFMRGAIAYRLKDFAKAESEFDSAVKLLPTYYQALYARGLTRKKLDQESAGRDDIDKARGMSAHVAADMAKMGIE